MRVTRRVLVFRAMDVHTPRTLEEALRLKAELPEARFLQGGTDVMVELNFGRSRPDALVNLAELAALRGRSRDDAERTSRAAVPSRPPRRRARSSRMSSRRSRRPPARSALRRSGTAARSAATWARRRPRGGRGRAPPPGRGA